MIVKHVLLIIVMLMLLTIIPTTATAQSPDLVGKVKAWQAAFNAGDLDTVMAMFAPDVEFEMVGLGTMTDRAMIEGLHAYAIGLKSQFRSPNCSVAGNTVTCETYETSEWHRIAGLPDTHYTSDIYVFNDAGLITKISATKAPESVQAEGEVLNSFIPWIAQNHPEAMPKLFTADGMFIYSGENAPIVLDLLQEWSQRLVGKVKAWLAAFNAGDLDTVMAMFAPDAEFELVGMGTMTDRAMIEGIHAYAIGLKGQFRSQNCSEEGNTVTCESYETSEWHRIAGLPDTHYTSDIYIFNDAGLIKKISSTQAPESVQAEGEVLNSFIPWIAQNHPEAMPKLFTADNMFIYSGDNAPIVLDLLQEWSQGLVDRVKAWQAAFNAGDLDTVMAMFAPDAEFELVGMGTMTDRAMIEGIHAYAIGLKSQLRSSNCSVASNAVTCETYETSEWHRIAGLPDTHYTSDIYVFNDAGLITKISATKAPESVQAEGEVLNAFIPWIVQNHPDAMPKLFTADNMFIYSGDNAAIVLDLLQEWKNPSPTPAPTATKASPSPTPAPTATKASPSPTPVPASPGGASSSSSWQLILGLVVIGVLIVGLAAWLWQARKSRV